MVTTQGERLNLELYQASHVMRSPVTAIYRVDKIARIAKILLETKHGGFPVLKSEDDQGFVGIITRSEVMLFLLIYYDGSQVRYYCAPISYLNAQCS